MSSVPYRDFVRNHRRQQKINRLLTTFTAEDCVKEILGFVTAVGTMTLETSQIVLEAIPRCTEPLSIGMLTNRKIFKEYLSG